MGGGGLAKLSFEPPLPPSQGLCRLGSLMYGGICHSVQDTRLASLFAERQEGSATILFEFSKS